MAFNVGETVGDYEIIGILGAGGMGKVYKVRNVISDRVEAMKVLLPDLASEAELADRFIREIKLLASLNHPHIAGLHTALRLNNQLLMVMEFVEGRTLEDRLKDGPIPAREAVAYVGQALSALGYAHERGVIHRDIKPANMMVTQAGDLKLMDFGIAKAVADRRLTMTGTTLGSLFYMSPEQVKGSSNLDGRSDLYSMGVTLYELITGMRPFKGDSDYSIMVAHLEQSPVPPVQIDPTISPALNEIILTAIQKDADRRFQSAKAFGAALGNVANTLPEAAPAPARQPAAPAPGALPQTKTAPPLAGPPRPQAPPPPAAPAPAAPPMQPPPYAAPQPPQQPPPYAQQQQPPMAPPAPQRAGYRGLWMALGAIAALAVLGVAAMQLPRFLKTRAGGPAQQETAAPVVQAPPATAAPEPVATPAEPAQQTAAPATPVPSEPVVSQAPGSTTARPRRERESRRGAQAVSGSAPSTPEQAFTPEPAAPAPQSAAPRAQESAPAQAPAVSEAALEELRDRLVTIGSRANALGTTLKNLENQQRAQGVGMRMDMSTAWKRMEAMLDDAEASLKSGNADRAKKNLDAAEREADKLDKFLGH